MWPNPQAARPLHPQESAAPARRSVAAPCQGRYRGDVVSRAAIDATRRNIEADGGQSSRPNKGAFPPPLWGRARERGSPAIGIRGRWIERSRSTERTLPLNGVRARKRNPQPPVPPRRNLAFRLNYRNAPRARIALHNVDMLGSDIAGRWTRHLVCFAYPVFRTRHLVTRNGPRLGRRARQKAHSIFSLSRGTNHDRCD